MIKNPSGKKGRFLKLLEENPFITSACGKLGISRSTFYRWCDKDNVFAKNVEVAQQKGRDKLNDFAESKLLENIQTNMHQAIAFWLQHNSKLYRPYTARLYADENEQQRQEFLKMQHLLDELANNVGVEELLKLAGHDPETFKAKVQKELKDQHDRRNKP